MSGQKTGITAKLGFGQQTAGANPLDFVPEKIPCDIPYGRPISLERAQAAIDAVVAESKKRDRKVNLAVVDPGGHLVAFQRMDGVMLASIPIAEHKARAAAAFRRPLRYSRTVSGSASQLSARVRWSHCISRRHSADRPGG